ncbi:RelA/SpoT domain protein [Chitinispirillum alkaliphilum]|nr:RelA/SpoT domain protein [Chitinispirillum alkaliphilum]
MVVWAISAHKIHMNASVRKELNKLNQNCSFTILNVIFYPTLCFKYFPAGDPMSNIIYPDKKEFQSKYQKLFPVYVSAIEDLNIWLKPKLQELKAHVTVKYRVKQFDSYYEKLLRIMPKQKKVSDNIPPIYDILGLRFVCPFLEDLAVVEDAMRKYCTIHETERKGAKQSIAEFGYISTHLLLEIPPEIIEKYPQLDLNLFEVQIRTFLQDAWAEVEHELIYKAKFTPLDEPLRRKLAALNANLTLSDIIFQEIRDYQRQLHIELENRRNSFLCQMEEFRPSVSSQHKVKPCFGKQKKAESVALSTDELLLDALYAHNNKDFTNAIDIYSLILKQQIEPSLRAIVLIHRGMAFFTEAKFTDALNDFTAATECEPQNAKAYYHLGIVHRVLDNSAAAIKALQKSIGLSPYNFEALIAMGKTYFEVEDFPAALEFCKKALHINPDSQVAISFRDLVLFRMNL